MKLFKVATGVASSKTLTLLCLSLLSSSSFAFINTTPSINQVRACMSNFTLDCGHWYVGANLGMSHTHDKNNPNSSNSVDQNGPGGSAVGGYQFNSLFGGELGFTQYKNSREYFQSTLVARTEHYAVHLAGTARYPFAYKWSVLGKLGAAYSYAQKVAEASGVAASSGAVSLYWGLGLNYSMTPRVDFIAQFAEARGNRYTGSTDLWSLGFNFAIV